MTYGGIYEEFCKKFPNAEVEDFRPAWPMYMPSLVRGIPNAISVWLKDGSEIIYKAKEDDDRSMLELLEKTYNDFINSEGGEGWLKIDGKEYSTDVGYAIEGLNIFMEVFKQRLVEREE